MNRPIAPPGLAAPAAAYSHAVLSMAPLRLLHTSGVVPTLPDGSVPDGLTEQVAAVWTNLGAILVAAAMGVADVVSITTYVVAGNDLAVVMAGRDEAMVGHRPASTLVLVPALAQPAWRLEIAVVAASSTA